MARPPRTCSAAAPPIHGRSPRPGRLSAASSDRAARPRFSLRWVILGGLAFLVLLIAVVTAGVIVASSERSSAPRGAITYVAPRADSTHFVSELPEARVVGTSIGGASLSPPRTWLHPVKPTILHHRPTTFSIAVLNSGRAPINAATLVVRIGAHSYTRRTASILPGKVATETFAVRSASLGTSRSARGHAQCEANGFAATNSGPGT